MNQLAIVNPRAGGVLSPGRFRELLEALAKVASKTILTEFAGHAQEFAAAAKDFDRVIVAGGDGTLLEVLNGMDLKRQTIALIPAGRGNSLARDLRLYPVRASLTALSSTATSRIDLLDVSFDDDRGQRHRRLCASTLALGYPTTVVRLAGARFKKLGLYCYAAAGAFASPDYMRVALSLQDEDPVERRLTGLVANNTRHLANFKALPKAACTDGWFDLMEMSAGRFGQCLHNLSALSRLGFYQPLSVRPATKIGLQLEEPQALMLDGELFDGVVSVQAGIRPSAAEFVCPQRLA